MSDEPRQEPAPEEQQPQAEQPPQDEPEEKPPLLSPDDPLLRTQSFYSERSAPLRPKDAAGAQQAGEHELPADIFWQQMEEYRRRQQALADQPTPTTPAADDWPHTAPEAPEGIEDQEKAP